MGFVDSAVNKLLLLEERKEAAIVLAPISSYLTQPSGLQELRPADPSPIPPAELPKTLPLSKREQEYPEIWKIQEASSLAKTDEVTKWLAAAKISNMNQERILIPDIRTLGLCLSRMPTLWRMSYSAGVQLNDSLILPSRGSSCRLSYLDRPGAFRWSF